MRNRYRLPLLVSVLVAAGIAVAWLALPVRDKCGTGRRIFYRAKCGPVPGAPADSVIAWPDTAAGEWTARSIGALPVVPGTRVTVETSRDGIGGYTGCNWYGLRPDGASYAVEMTARGCTRPAGIDQQERRFARLLPLAVAARLRGDTLALHDSAGTELMVLVRRRALPMDPSRLVGTSWRAWSSTRPGLDTSRVTIAFARDTVRGFGGCRDFVGTYSARGDRIRFTHIAMLTLECPDDRARVAEENLTTVLSETSHFELRQDRLSLTTFGGDTVRFVSSRRR